MSRSCGSSKPTPTPPNDLAMKPGKTRKKIIAGNAGTIIRQTTVKNLPRTACVAGVRDEERRYDKANRRQKPPAKIGLAPSAKFAGGSMKSSAYGLSSSLIIRGLESSMYAKIKFRTGREHQRADAVACQAELWASPEMQGTEAVPRLALADRGAMLVNAEREACS